MKNWRYFLKMMVMLKSNSFVNGNVGNVSAQSQNPEYFKSIEGGISIPTIPTLPLKDWCEKHDAVEDFWDHTPSCQICNIKMKKRKCMGGYAMYCDNYWKCGQRVELSEVSNENS